MSEAAPAPDATPAVPTDTPARIAEIEGVMKNDIDRYFREGLSDELLTLRRAEAEAAESEGEAEGEAEAADGEEPAETGDAPEAEEGEVGEEAEETEPLKPWTPPEGMEVAEHARPHIAKLDSIASDEAQRDQIIALHHEMVEAQTVRLAEVNAASKAATVANLKSELGDGFAAYRDQVDAAFKALPQEDRAELKTARLADGRLLLSTRVGIELLHQLGTKPPHEQPRQDQRTAMQTELRELDSLMASDIDNYNYSKWKNTGLSPSARRLELMREMHTPSSKPSAAALRSEEAELVALHARDPMTFEYFENWKGTGLTGARRLHQIRSGRG